ncbi:MAG: hypothetical protein CL847_04920 [Crocinitomicaceae bacterium]|nr:hypothetical protein [Crocinitomicaceae bacterium]|tara:strand:- start:8162 stop:9376 length:1215 start_codon:yes stop_codon:yes gene_type:complete
MDSLSQITLGASVGEVILGKKIGNRAMVWGAVAGTIPDLDVIGNYFMTDLQGLLLHRGITHSLFFCVIGAFVFGTLVSKLYASKHHKLIAITTKLIASLVILKVIHFLAGIFSNENMVIMVISSLVVLGIFARHVFRKYLSGNWIKPEVSTRAWQWMMFWVFITHIILDCFTLYGTQVFAPFSNYKVSWGTIAVADPLYTVPFLAFLISATFFNRDSRWRSSLNNIGLIISCLYLSVTIVNKTRINTQFENELKGASIDAIRYSTNATLLNNILWTCTAESNEQYHIGEYSFLDEMPVDFLAIDKNHHLLRNLDTDPTLKALRWFSDDYFCITQSDEGLLFNDLRFGVFKNSEGEHEGYIFSFLLTEKENGEYLMSKTKRGPDDRDGEDYFKSLLNRIKGKKEV